MAAPNPRSPLLNLVPAALPPDAVALSETGAAPAARVITAEARRLLVFCPGEEARVAVSVAGEPVAPLRVTRHAAGLPGLQLLRSASCEDPDLPWRIVGPAGEARLGRDIAERWTLAGGHTAYLCAPAGADEVVLLAEGEPIPILPGGRYRFAGLFGLHRCRATLRLDLLGPDGGVLASAGHEIARRPGGRTREEYSSASVGLTAPRDARSARLTLAMRPTEETGQDAHLFFTDIRFGWAEAGSAAWRRAVLERSEAEELAAGRAALVEIVLPPVPDLGAVALGVTDPDGRSRPLTLHQRASGLAPRFLASGFDGVTLSGRLVGHEATTGLALLVDGGVVAGQEVAPGPEGEASEVAIRLPDAALDGGPHVIELVDETGRTLHAAAETLRSVLTAPSAMDAGGRLLLAPELQPLARHRYAGLLARLAEGDTSRAAEAVLCHAILTGQAGAAHEHDAQARRLNLPERAAPDVTVLIRGEADPAALRHTVAALLFAAGRVTFEAMRIGVEVEPEARIDGFRAIPEATGDDLARAAEAGRGRRIVFLDIGSEPLSGWLDALWDAFEAGGSVGTVGPRLLAPSGRLAEAGRLVWASGRGEALDHGGNPDDPCAACLREVDALSPAALMVDRERLLAVLTEEGADAQDGYDLCFRLAAAGGRVLCAPAAAVALPHGPSDATHGHALAPPTTSPEFRRRWAEACRRRPEEGGASTRGAVGEVLFLDLQVPRPDRDAGSYAAEREIALFQALGYRVTFLPLDLDPAGRYGDALRAGGVELLHAPFAGTLDEALASRAGAFDLVYMTRHNVARAALPSVRRYQAGAKRVLNVADLHFLRELRAGLAARSREAVARSRLTRESELGLMREVDLTLTYSDVEVAVIQSHHLDRAKVGRLPWVVDPNPAPPPAAGRSGIAFLGSFGHRPNVEALQAFVRDVMPPLRARLPGIELRIFGSQVNDEVRALAAHDIRVLGHAADLARVFGPARVFVAPLVSGAGIKGKVLAAMAEGCPCVLSPVAAEGLGARPGIHHLLAERTDQWVEAIACLVEEDAAWTAMAASAQALVRERHGFPHGVAMLRRSLEMIEIYAGGGVRARA